jgi:hypothetical protein
VREGVGQRRSVTLRREGVVVPVTVGHVGGVEEREVRRGS